MPSRTKCNCKNLQGVRGLRFFDRVEVVVFSQGGWWKKTGLIGSPGHLVIGSSELFWPRNNANQPEICAMLSSLFP
jgi:hypothetical protein